MRAAGRPGASQSAVPTDSTAKTAPAGRKWGSASGTELPVRYESSRYFTLLPALLYHH